MNEKKEYFLNDGGSCKIISVVGNGKVEIEFTGYEGQSIYVYKDNLIKGKVKNPFKPSLCGIGVIGKGKYDSKTTINGVNIYRIWVGMVKRCYCAITLKNSPSYLGCSVDESFLSFQVFAEWCLSQNFLKKGFQLDKDLLVRGNRVYSAETCCFLPKDLNDVLSYRKNSKSKYLIGVSCNSEGRFISKIGLPNKQKYLGTYDTAELAFYVYKEAKESYIKELANQYKDQIDPRAYSALMSWEVNIDD